MPKGKSPNTLSNTYEKYWNPFPDSLVFRMLYYLGFIRNIMSSIQWNSLSNLQGLEKIKEESKEQKILIFKHSTQCGISAAARHQLESSWKTEEMPGIKPYFLDLIRFRDISNQIAEDFGVTHQSPQVLVVEDGKVTYHISHYAIQYGKLKEIVNGVTN